MSSFWLIFLESLQSLEPRTRSIYEVLDCSAATSDNKETETKTSEAELSQVVRKSNIPDIKNKKI